MQAYVGVHLDFSNEPCRHDVFFGWFICPNYYSVCVLFIFVSLHFLWYAAGNRGQLIWEHLVWGRHEIFRRSISFVGWFHFTTKDWLAHLPRFEAYIFVWIFHLWVWVLFGITLISSECICWCCCDASLLKHRWISLTGGLCKIILFLGLFLWTSVVLDDFSCIIHFRIGRYLILTLVEWLHLRF